MDYFRDRIKSYIREQARPEEKFGHQPRLYALTREIGRGLDYDDDVVFAAAWLHDVGVFVGHRPEDVELLGSWDHTAYAMEKAPQILSDSGFPLAKQAAVVEAIRTHQPAGQPTMVEGEILRDADILEQLGAIGVMRTVCKVGRDSRFADFTAAAAALRKAVAHLPGEIHLMPARVMAESRVKFLQMFLGRLEEEAGTELG